jgi:hypothetical protein
LRYTYTPGSETPGAIIGTAVTGVVDGTYTHVWNFDVSAWAVGDYWVQVSGVSTVNARPVPVRVNALGAFYEPSWEIMNVAHAAAVVYPSAITGLCDVLFSVSANGTAVHKATVSAIVDANSEYDGGIVSTTATTAQTDASGNAILRLLQNATFTAGGIYTLKVTDRRGKLIWEKRCRIANTSTANAEDFTAI